MPTSSAILQRLSGNFTISCGSIPGNGPDRRQWAGRSPEAGARPRLLDAGRAVRACRLDGRRASRTTTGGFEVAWQGKALGRRALGAGGRAQPHECAGRHRRRAPRRGRAGRRDRGAWPGSRACGAGMELRGHGARRHASTTISRTIPTAIRDNASTGCAQQVGAQARILAVLEPRSNTHEAGRA